MLRQIHTVGLLTALLTASGSQADTVSLDLLAEVSTPVPAGSTLPYEIHITITDAAGLPETPGLCMFVLNLRSDLGVEQGAVQAFSPEITAGFGAISLQHGVFDGSGGVSDIGAAQPCILMDDTVLGIGLDGQTMVARGELHLPPTTGQFTVRIEPVQVSLIAPDGTGAVNPEAAVGGSLTITVGPAAGGDAGTDGLGGGDDDAGTDGLGGGDDGAGTDGIDGGDSGTDGGPDDGGTDGLEEDDNSNSGAGTDGLGDDDNSNSGAGAGGDTGAGGNVPRGAAGAGRPTLGLCGAGLIGLVLTTLTAWAWIVRRW